MVGIWAPGPTPPTTVHANHPFTLLYLLVKGPRKLSDHPSTLWLRIWIHGHWFLCCFPGSAKSYFAQNKWWFYKEYIKKQKQMQSLGVQSELRELSLFCLFCTIESEDNNTWYCHRPFQFVNTYASWSLVYAVCLMGLLLLVGISARLWGSLCLSPLITCL